MNEREKNIISIASDPKELRDYADERVEVNDGDFGAHADLGDDLNLNAIAIGLGLANIEYQPENFLGLVYRTDPRGIDTTVILLWDGQATAIDSTDKSAAKNAIIKTAERLKRLNEAGDEDDDDLWDITVPDESDIEVEKIR